jgi:1-acyl-sn-glycerol-3-phosphate acyltransferase
MHPFYRFILFLAWLVFKIFYRTKAYGMEHFPKGSGIIASNHVSYLDPPLIAISSPEEVHFLARSTLFDIPLFGRLIRALNSHPVKGEASDASVFKDLCKLLQGNNKVIMFPEGKRSFTGELSPLKLGISVLVMRTHCCIIPTYVHGTYKIWRRGQSLPKPWGKTACIFGTPIKAEDFSHLEKREAQEAMTKRLAEAILALRAWYENGAHGTPP